VEQNKQSLLIKLIIKNQNINAWKNHENVRNGWTNLTADE
jgi:hypothetical protein